MALVAEFTIPATALPGADALAEMPDARLELERIVPTNETALPFFWLWGGDPETFRDRFVREEEIADLRLLERVDGGALFRAQWTPEATIVRAIERLDATVVEATGREDTWCFEVRAPDRERFAEFQRVFDEEGVPVRLHCLMNLTEATRASHSLTPTQRKTLLAAYRKGYFDEPRRISQAELGEQFGVSGRAVAKRLRRGTRNLIGSTIAVGAEEEPEGT